MPAAPQDVSKDLALVRLAAAGFVVLGFPIGALGVAWPELRATFGQPIAALGLLLAPFWIVSVLASVLAGRAIPRLGEIRVAALGCGLGAVGLASVAVTPRWVILPVAMAVGGAGTGTLDAAVNTLAARSGRPRIVNLLHAGFAVGATLAPLLLTGLVRVGVSWRVTYLLLAAMTAIVTVPWVQRMRAAPGPVGVAEGGGADAEALTGRVVAPALVGAASLLVYVVVELSAGQWSATLFDEARAMTAATAGLWASGFWGAFCVGRIVAASVGDRLHPARMLTGNLVVMSAGLVLFWVAPSPVLGGVGLLVAGFGMAPVFPSIIALTPLRLGDRAAASVVGYQVAAAGIGAGAGPALIGLALDVRLESLGPLLLGATAVLIALEAAARRLVPTGATPAGPAGAGASPSVVVGPQSRS